MLIPIIIHLRAKFDDRLLLKLSISLSRSNSSVMRIHCVFVFAFVFFAFVIVILLHYFFETTCSYKPIQKLFCRYSIIWYHTKHFFSRKFLDTDTETKFFNTNIENFKKLANVLKLSCPPPPQQAKPKQMNPFLSWGFPTPMRESYN